jgi:hypothetical protein
MYLIHLSYPISQLSNTIHSRVWAVSFPDGRTDWELWLLVAVQNSKRGPGFVSMAQEKMKMQRIVSDKCLLVSHH